MTEIYALVKDLLAKQQYTSFQDIMSRGIPRVMIDSGRILAKISLNYSVTEDIEEPSISAAKVSETNSLSKPNVAENITMTNLKDKYLHSSIATKLAKTRVGVSIPNPTNETTSINSSLWGEIEIKFKAVD
ncbi:hypothetical protein ACLKMH_22100 [Psychromonas sp. KJ10-10]|uniref:hypothetical protein n=1 Tax=Psychromonas sp. KJ10-10 TaxID=3391823 RepID=UPI0039B498AC